MLIWLAPGASGTSMLIQADTSSTIETTAENCSYVIVGAAIDSLLRNIESETAIEAYSDFKERRQRADEIMFDLVGQQPQLFYSPTKIYNTNSGNRSWASKPNIKHCIS